MQLNNRDRRNLATQNPANQTSQASEKPSRSGNADPPATFDDWLDGRLKTLYQTVLNEPLPPEIMTLLGGQRKPDRAK
jgi:hypothetical protein